MLLSTLSASLLENMLAGKGAIQMGKWTIRAFRIFNAVSYGLTNFVKKGIVKMSLDLMLCIQEIIYLKERLVLM